MNVSKIFVASAVAWALLPACRDQRAREGYAAGAKDATPGVTSPVTGGKTATPEGEATANLATKDGGAAILQENAPTAAAEQGTHAEGTAGAGAAAEPERTLARATLTGNKAKGTATIHSTEAGNAVVMVNLENAPAGRYAIHVVDGTDCNTISILETQAGALGKAGEGAVTVPGTKTTAASSESIGIVSVDASGHGSSEVALTNTAGLDRRLVILFPEAPSGKVATLRSAKDATACGTLRLETAPERAG